MARMQVVVQRHQSEIPTTRSWQYYNQPASKGTCLSTMTTASMTMSLIWTHNKKVSNSYPNSSVILLSQT